MSALLNALSLRPTGGVGRVRGAGGPERHSRDPLTLTLSAAPRGRGNYCVLPRSVAHATIYLLLAASLCACQTIKQDIPPDDTGWVPQGINAANIAAMAAVPRDLAHGRGDLTGTGHTTAQAVIRLWKDQVKPLPTASASASSDSTAAAPPAMPAAPPTGGQGSQ